MVVSSEIGNTLIRYADIWGHTSEMYRLSNNKVEKLDINNGLPTDVFSCAFEDDAGYLWICTSDGMMKLMSDSSWKSFQDPGIIDMSWAQEIEISESGEIWISSHNGSLNTFQNNNWFSLGKKEGIPFNTQDLDIDKDGNLWVGSWDDGKIFRFGENQWSAYDREDGLEIGENIWALEAGTDGSIWAGGDGLARFDGNKWEKILNGDREGFVDMRSILAIDLDGSIWVGGYDYRNEAKIARLIDDRWIMYDKSDGLEAGSMVGTIEISPTGIVYAGTARGLFKFVNNNWEEVGNTYLVNGIAFEGDGSVWVATEYSGILHYKNGELVEQYTVDDGLPSLRMNAIAVAPDASIWAGGWGGVVKITPKE